MHTQDQIETYLQHKELEDRQNSQIDAHTKREFLKRKYLWLHHMNRKVKDYQKLKEITKMKRQVLRMLGNQK